jgi:hypothetical protein
MVRIPIAVLLAGAVSCLAAPSESALARARTALASLPLRFEVNQGQFHESVRYAATAGDFKLLLTRRGATLALPGSDPVSLSLLHSNPAPKIEALDQMRAHTDYFIGPRPDWHTHIANYARIRYREVYPGVDVVYYGHQNQLEYDFVLQPGADPDRIRLQFRGAHGLAVTPEGDIAFDAPSGRLVQKRPVIYQEDPRTAARREIQGRYVLLAHNVVGLKLDHYDRTRAVTIDPILNFSSYLGGPLTDQIVAMKLTPAGLLYVTGPTDNSTSGPSNLPASGNFYQGTNAGITNIFVAIIDTTNNYQLVYFTYLGGTNLDIPKAMQLDANGNIYLTGSTTSTDFPMVGSSVLASGAGAAVFAFVAAINPGLNGPGSLFYSTYLGTNTANSEGDGIDVDPQGNIYVIGSTSAPDFLVTQSAYQAVQWGPSDAFLCEINIYTPNLMYSTFLGGESDEQGVGIAVAPNGLVYFAINTFSQQFPQAGYQYQPTLKGFGGIAIGVMDMTQQGVNSLLYTTYFGGSNMDQARKMVLDRNGDLLLTGTTLSTDLPVTGDAVQLHNNGNGDAFVAVVNPNSRQFVKYLTYLGGSSGDVAYDVAIDAAGNLYVTGYTLSSDFPVTGDAPQLNWGKGVETFMTRLTPGTPGSAGISFSTYLGQDVVNVSNALAVAPDGTMYFAGYTEGLWPTTGNATQLNFGGGFSDGFIASITGK